MKFQPVFIAYLAALVQHVAAQTSYNTVSQCTTSCGPAYVTPKTTRIVSTTTSWYSTPVTTTPIITVTPAPGTTVTTTSTNTAITTVRSGATVTATETTIEEIYTSAWTTITKTNAITTTASGAGAPWPFTAIKQAPGYVRRKRSPPLQQRDPALLGKYPTLISCRYLITAHVTSANTVTASTSTVTAPAPNRTITTITTTFFTKYDTNTKALTTTVTSTSSKRTTETFTSTVTVQETATASPRLGSNSVQCVDMNMANAANGNRCISNLLVGDNFLLAETSADSWQSCCNICADTAGCGGYGWMIDGICILLVVNDPANCLPSAPSGDYWTTNCAPGDVFWAGSGQCGWLRNDGEQP